MGDIETGDANLDRRRRLHDALAARLAALSDDALAAQLAEAAAGRANDNGNQSAVIDVEGGKVFVKQIALTDVERRAANEGSTANLFDLPLFYQYGVGSAGFGAWRELSACVRAGAWALSGECPYFPLVYHWRVLPRTPPPPSDEQRALVQGATDYWDHSDAVRARLEAIAGASASIAVFLEYAPETLAAWLNTRSAGRTPDDATQAAILRIHDQWRAAAAFMNERGMLHFDLHRHNVLTDGEQLYVADFGLALCADFDLAPAERAFFEIHRFYDRCYVSWAFVNWLSNGGDRPVSAPALRALVERYAPLTQVFDTFISALRRSKTTPYPAAALEAALKAG